MSNLIIRKSQLNSCILTLAERSELDAPFYLIVFSSKFDTDGATTFTSTKSVATNSRFDKLEIEEKTNPDWQNGEVYFANEGEYTYIVYESEMQTDNVEDTTGRILQQGLLIVI